MLLVEAIVLPVGGMIAYKVIDKVIDKAIDKVIEAYEEDINKALNNTVKAVNQAYEEGWQRDYNTGGISSWGKQYRSATAYISLLNPL